MKSKLEEMRAIAIRDSKKDRRPEATYDLVSFPPAKGSTDARYGVLQTLSTAPPPVKGSGHEKLASMATVVESYRLGKRVAA